MLLIFHHARARLPPHLPPLPRGCSWTPSPAPTPTSHFQVIMVGATVKHHVLLQTTLAVVFGRDSSIEKGLILNPKVFYFTGDIWQACARGFLEDFRLRLSQECGSTNQPSSI